MNTLLRCAGAAALQNPVWQPGRAAPRMPNRWRRRYAVAATVAASITVDCLFDDVSWAVQYLEVNLRDKRPGEHVLVAPGWIAHVAWSDRPVGTR